MRRFRSQKWIKVLKLSNTDSNEAMVNELQPTSLTVQFHILSCSNKKGSLIRNDLVDTLEVRSATY